MKEITQRRATEILGRKISVGNTLWIKNGNIVKYNETGAEKHLIIRDPKKISLKSQFCQYLLATIEARKIFLKYNNTKDHHRLAVTASHQEDALLEKARKYLASVAEDMGADYRCPKNHYVKIQLGGVILWGNLGGVWTVEDVIKFRLPDKIYEDVVSPHGINLSQAIPNLGEI